MGVGVEEKPANGNGLTSRKSSSSTAAPKIRPVKREWPFKPALYTTALAYIAVQIAILSFVGSYYNIGISNITDWTLSKLEEFEYTRDKLDQVRTIYQDTKDNIKTGRNINIADIKIDPDVKTSLKDAQVLNVEQLALFDGTRPSKPIYLALLGRVYDVTRGKKHYGKGGSYDFFAGRDATRAFVTGDFTEAGLKDDTVGLTNEDLLGIRDWVTFYEKDYSLVGVVSGRYYDSQGDPTEELYEALSRLQLAAEWRATKAAEAKVFPPCNSEWHQDKGRVWCSTKSGGINRDWSGLPRLLKDPSSGTENCVCVKNFGAGLSNAASKGSNRGDLDHPLLKEYPGCSSSANSCKMQD